MRKKASSNTGIENLSRVTVKNADGSTREIIRAQYFDAGKKKQKTVPDIKAGKDFLRDWDRRQKSLGAYAAHGHEKIASWAALASKAEVAGVTLEECVSGYLDRLASIRQRMTVRDAVSSYLKEMKTRWQPTTFKPASHKLLSFMQGRESAMMHEITDSVSEYLTSLDLSPVTQDNHKRDLSGLFSWALKRGIIVENPCAQIGSFAPRKASSAASSLSPDEVVTVLKSVVENYDSRYCPFVLISLFAGIRPMEYRKRVKRKDGKNETWALTWAHVLDHDGSIMIPAVASKTSAARRVPITPTLQAWIEWMRQKEGTLSGTITQGRFKFHKEIWFQNNPAAAHILKGKVDILRHCYGTYRVAFEGGEVGKVALEMGNSEAIIKQNYFDSSRTKKDAERYWSMLPASFDNEKSDLKIA